MGTQKTWAWIAGIVLLLVGILGFISAPILGIFEVNATHNIIHLLTGLIFIWAAAKNAGKSANVWLGVIYIVVAILGFFGALSFISVASGNDPDTWLHLVLGAISLLIGLTAKS